MTSLGSDLLLGTAFGILADLSLQAWLRRSLTPSQLLGVTLKVEEEAGTAVVHVRGGGITFVTWLQIEAALEKERAAGSLSVRLDVTRAGLVDHTAQVIATRQPRPPSDARTHTHTRTHARTHAHTTKPPNHQTTNLHTNSRTYSRTYSLTVTLHRTRTSPISTPTTHLTPPHALSHSLSHSRTLKRRSALKACSEYG